MASITDVRPLAIVAFVILVMLAGCAGIGLEHEPDHPEDERLESITAQLDQEEADAFVAAIADADGITDDGDALLDRLMELDGDHQRASVARSIASQGHVPTNTVDTIDRILASPDGFQSDVFAHGLTKSTDTGLLDGELVAFGIDLDDPNPRLVGLALSLSEGGYTAVDVAYLERLGALSEDQFQWAQVETIEVLNESALDEATVTALDDTNDDGLLDGMAAHLGLDPAVNNTVIVSLAEPLAHDGYDDTDLAYLQRVSELAVYRGNQYEGWAQAEQLGLLDETVADGDVTEEEVWLIENDAENRLLNGMELSFGTDPDLADTSGDGYPDHLKWGPMRDLGLPVHPSQPDVYVEIDAAAGVDQPADEQLEKITTTFAEEPPEDIGAIHVHFHRCEDSVEPVSTVGDLHERTAEHRQIRGLGFHYLLVNEGRITWLGEEWSGIAWLGYYGDPAMVARGDIPADAKTSLIAHELGHKLGILATDFEGVDSTAYTFDEYNSVMNYNRTTEITFSTGEPFNDYRQMAERNFGSQYEPIEELERMWADGSAEEDVLC